MTVEMITVTREQLLRRRREIVAMGDLSEEQLRERAAAHVLTPDERDQLNDLDGVDFLLGDDR